VKSSMLKSSISLSDAVMPMPPHIWVGHMTKQCVKDALCPLLFFESKPKHRFPESAWCSSTAFTAEAPSTNLHVADHVPLEQVRFEAMVMCSRPLRCVCHPPH
jgi:hypothetical protein